MRTFRFPVLTDVSWKLQGQWICFLYHSGSVKLFCGYSVSDSLHELGLDMAPEISAVCHHYTNLQKQNDF
jgi:hypothetical protein